jgi:hypothetical protein
MGMLMSLGCTLEDEREGALPYEQPFLSHHPHVVDEGGDFVGGFVDSDTEPSCFSNDFQTFIVD